MISHIYSLPKTQVTWKRKHTGARGGEEWYKVLGSGYVIAIALMISHQLEIAAKDLLV